MIFASRIEAAFGRLTLRGNGPVCARITTMVSYHQDGRSAGGEPQRYLPAGRPEAAARGVPTAGVV